MTLIKDFVNPENTNPEAETLYWQTKGQPFHGFSAKSRVDDCIDRFYKRFGDAPELVVVTSGCINVGPIRFNGEGR